MSGFRRLDFRDEPPTSTATRRAFMRAAGATGLGIGALSLASAAAQPAFADAAGLSDDLGNIAHSGIFRGLKRAFLLDPQVTYMNVGTTGSMPKVVLDRYNENNRAVARDPRETFGGASAMQAELAPQFGCNSDEIVLSGNTTEGMTMTLNGFVWSEGDAIITTNHEHPAGTAPMALQRDRHGVEIVVVPVPVGPRQEPEDYVRLFADAIKATRSKGFRVRMLVFSAPTYKTGTMLPIEPLAELAIEEGIYTLVDGAHATGMFDLDFHALGVDFMACAGHKWQCGPGGTGIWYIRNQTQSNPLPLPRFYPTLTHLYGLIEGDVVVPNGEREPPDRYNVAAYNQSHGNPNYPELRALVDVCNFWEAIGRERIENYILGLSLYCKERIAEHWGEEALYSPMHSRPLLSALSSFVPLNAFRRTDGTRSTEFVDRLREEYGFVVRNVNAPMRTGPDHYPIRISTHLFHTRSDVDGLIAAMINLARKMNAGM